MALRMRKYKLNKSSLSIFTSAKKQFRKANHFQSKKNNRNKSLILSTKSLGNLNSYKNRISQAKSQLKKENLLPTFTSYADSNWAPVIDLTRVQKSTKHAFPSPLEQKNHSKHILVDFESPSPDLWPLPTSPKTIKNNNGRPEFSIYASSVSRQKQRPVRNGEVSNPNAKM